LVNISFKINKDGNEESKLTPKFRKYKMRLNKKNELDNSLKVLILI
jgi:hypothetical protein